MIPEHVDPIAEAVHAVAGDLGEIQQDVDSIAMDAGPISHEVDVVCDLVGAKSLLVEVNANVAELDTERLDLERDDIDANPDAAPMMCDARRCPPR
jgi:hypothetical protein